MSLTTTAHSARNIIKYGGVGLVLLLISWSILTSAIALYIKLHPPKYPPNCKYGVLPQIVFPEKKFDKKSFTFEFATDTPPKFNDQIKVFAVQSPIVTLVALDEAKKIAKEMKFLDEPTETSPASGIYVFQNNSFNTTLTMNILDGSFKYSYPYLNDQLLLNPVKVPTKEDAIAEAKSFLSGAKELADDLANGIQQVTYWKIDYDGLKSVPSQSQANAVRVDFYRQNTPDEMKIMTADVKSASVSVLISGSDVESKKVIEVNYKYSPIDRDLYATYPLLTSQQAIDALKQGNYWPATDVSANSVIIRKMYLAYFEPVTLTNYLEPVYVFEGGDSSGFIAYVPAVPEVKISNDGKCSVK